MTKLSALNVVITGDSSDLTSDLDKAKRELQSTQKVASKTQSSLGGLATGMTRAAKSSGAMTSRVQNASYQVADFAVQVTSGTSATRALAQQLPQLLGGFGMLGAVAGAAVAILVPMASAMSSLSAEGKDVAQVFGTLSPVMSAIGQGFKAVGGLAITMAETIVNNLDRILITAGGVAAFMAGRWIAAFVAAKVATLTLSGALVALRAALIRTGIGALIVGAGELVYQFTRLMKAAGGIGNAIGLLGDVAKEVFGRLGQRVSLFGELMRGAGMVITGVFQAAFGAVGKAFNDYVLVPIAKGLNMLVGLANSLGASFSTIKLPTAGGMLDDGKNTIAGGSAVMSSALGSMDEVGASPLESVQKIRDLLASMKEEKITLGDILGGGSSEGEDGKDGKTLAEQVAEIEEGLRTQEEILKASYDKQQSILDQAIAKKVISERKYKALSEAIANSHAHAMVKASNDQTRGTLSNLATMFQGSKKIGAGLALANSYLAFTEVLKDPSFIGRPFARIAAAGAALASGLQAVRGIKSASIGGGAAATPSAGSAMASVASAPAATAAASSSASGGRSAEAAQSPSVQLTLIGEQGFTRSQIVQIAEALNDSGQDGQRLIDIRGRR